MRIRLEIEKYEDHIEMIFIIDSQDHRSTIMLLNEAKHQKEWSRMMRAFEAGSTYRIFYNDTDNGEVIVELKTDKVEFVVTNITTKGFGSNTTTISRDLCEKVFREALNAFD